MPARRFPPPWTAEVTPNCFIVRDANGQALTYIYCGAQRPSCSARTRLDGSRRISPYCRTDTKGL